MKKEFSKEWVSSRQPRKQRKYLYNAPLHIRQKMMACRLDDKLTKEFGTRSLPVRKGDKVMIMRGQFAKTLGEVTKTDLKKTAVYVDSAKRKKASGQEYYVPISHSNVRIIEIKKDDKKRQKIIQRKSKK